MLKTKLLSAAAAFAFVAAGVTAQAQETKAQEDKRQETPNAERRPAPAPRPETGGAMQRKEAPKAAEGERSREAPKSAEGERPNEAPAAAQNERRDQDDATRKDATRTEAPRDGEPKSADVDKRATPDAMRHDKADAKMDSMRQDKRVVRGEPRVNGVKIERERAVRIGEILRRRETFERPDFDVRVGARVPEAYGVRPLPPEIIAFEPEYRGYDYFVDAENEIVFVSPDNHQIVGTIDYDQRAAAVDAPRAARPCPPEE